LDELQGDLVQSASLESALSNKIIRGLSNESNIQGGNDRWSLVATRSTSRAACRGIGGPALKVTYEIVVHTGLEVRFG